MPESEEAPDLTKSTSSEVDKRNDIEVMREKRSRATGKGKGSLFFKLKSHMLKVSCISVSIHSITRVLNILLTVSS